MGKSVVTAEVGDDAALTRAVLHLYECVVDESHVEQMMMLVGSWLSEADDAHYVLKLERHSRKILNTVERLLDVDRIIEQVDAVRSSVVGERLRTTLEAGQQLEIDDADWMEFERQLGASDSVAMIVHCYRAPDRRPDLALLNSRLNGGLYEVSLIQQRSGIDQAVASMLKKDLNLTDAELRVVNLALLGLSSSQVARQLSRSRETVRSQIKSATGKLAVSGQAELGAAIRRLEIAARRAGITASPESWRPSAHVAPATMEFERIGAPDGRPVLFMHCFLHGRHIPLSLAPRLAALGVTIWSPTRPGFGASMWNSDAGSAEDLLVRLGDATAAFLQQQGLSRVDVIGHATGFGIAYSFANRFPEYVRQLLGFDPVPPANKLETILDYQGLFRASALAMYRTPVTFDLMHHLVLKRLSGFRSPKKRMRRHILYPSVELENLETPEGIEAMTRNVRDLIAQDLRGCIAEARAYRSNWADVAPDANTRPRCTVFVSVDNPFVSPTGSEKFAKAIGAKKIGLGSAFPYLTDLPHLTEHLLSTRFD